MTIWNAARAASRRPLPKPRKMHGPVGPTVVDMPQHAGQLINGVAVSWTAYCEAMDGRDRACSICGYLVCMPGCDDDELPPPMSAEDARKALESISGINSVARGSYDYPIDVKMEHGQTAPADDLRGRQSDGPSIDEAAFVQTAPAVLDEHQLAVYRQYREWENHLQQHLEFAKNQPWA